MRSVNHGQHHLQSTIDIRAAGKEIFDEAEGRLTRVVVILLQFGAKAFDGAVVGDDVERVAGAEIVEHEFQGFLGLLKLFAGHAAGAIDDKITFLAGRSSLAAFHFGTGEQEEEAIFIRFGPIADDAHKLAVVGVEEQAKIRGGDRLFGFYLDDGVLAVWPFDVDGVRRL